MLKVIFIAMIIYGITSLLRRRAVRRSSRSQEVTKQVTSSEMIACERCGTFVLQGEAVASAGHIYCGEKCLNS